MTPQRLDRVLTAWRIGDPDGAFPIFDATGSTLYPGRWNGARTPMIYASEHYSTAMLEKLGWDHPSCAVSRPWGERWQQERRSLLLLVPSVVARMERHVLINPDHPERAGIAHGLHEPVWWDRRLFA